MNREISRRHCLKKIGLVAVALTGLTNLNAKENHQSNKKIQLFPQLIFKEYRFGKGTGFNGAASGPMPYCGWM